MDDVQRLLPPPPLRLQLLHLQPRTAADSPPCRLQLLSSREISASRTEDKREAKEAKEGTGGGQREAPCREAAVAAAASSEKKRCKNDDVSET